MSTKTVAKIHIEKNIPLPEVQRYRKTSVAFPFAQMNVGDSFKVSVHLADQLRNYSTKYKKAHKVDFTTRAEGQFVRLWRTE